MPLRPALAVIAFGSVVACTQFPDLDSRLSPEAQAARYPQLVPVEELNALQPDTETGPDTTDALTARVTALRVRAARLKRAVIDGSARARMQSGVSPI